jgi:hypothetical protein
MGDGWDDMRGRWVTRYWGTVESFISSLRPCRSARYRACSK